MKKAILTLLAIACITNVFSQKTEFAIGLNSGLFSYSGGSASGSTFLNHHAIKTYTNNIYGAKNGLSYGLSANLKRLVANNHLILGIDLGYEVLRSKVSIIGVSSSSTMLNAQGSSYLNTSFINLHPNLGYRFQMKDISFDVTGGLDIGYIIKAQEKGQATDQNGVKYTTELDRKNVNNDLRPRVQLGLKKNMVGAYVGYAYGLQNFMQGYVGGSPDASSRLIRFGLTYQLNK